MTLSISMLFGLIGLGSSLLLIPLFNIMGMDFNVAKSMGLLINGVTTTSITIYNIKKKNFKFKELFLLVIVSSISALLGAYSSNYISENMVKSIFIGFIVFSLLLLYMEKKEINQKNVSYHSISVLVYIGMIAFVGGLIGVGGGAIYLPLFLYIGLNIKKSIAITSALIPVVSFSAFFTYSSFVDINWSILGVVTIAAILGGYWSSKITHSIENDKYLKILVTSLLIAVAVYMIYVQIQGYYYV